MLYSVIDDLPGPLGVICNDAGGANQIFAMLSKTARADIKLTLSGPAASLYEASRLSFPVLGDLQELVSLSETILTGTGWSSDLEFDALREARSMRKKSIAVLDHWVNYRMRFERNGTEILPDDLWVVDSWAERIARLEFPGQNLRLVPDIYTSEIIKQVGNPPPEESAEILYLFEPARSSWGRRVQGEWQSWSHFLKHVDRVGARDDSVIRARPHPALSPSLFYDLEPHVGDHPIILDQFSLVESLTRARWVVGMSSSVLPIALETDRVAISCLPQWAPRCQLPHHGITLI